MVKLKVSLCCIRKELFLLKAPTESLKPFRSSDAVQASRKVYVLCLVPIEWGTSHLGIYYIGFRAMTLNCELGNGSTSHSLPTSFLHSLTHGGLLLWSLTNSSFVAANNNNKYYWVLDSSCTCVGRVCLR